MAYTGNKYTTRSIYSAKNLKMAKIKVVNRSRAKIYTNQTLSVNPKFERFKRYLKTTFFFRLSIFWLNKTSLSTPLEVRMQVTGLK